MTEPLTREQIENFRDGLPIGGRANPLVDALCDLALRGLAQPSQQSQPFDRRKTGAWCKEHKCPMHYCSHDRRNNAATHDGIPLVQSDTGRASPAKGSTPAAVAPNAEAVDWAELASQYPIGKSIRLLNAAREILCWHEATREGKT